jgi:DNA repair protein RecN (Recombination protein N)
VDLTGARVALRFDVDDRLAAVELRRYADGIEANPERLAELEDRLHLVGKLLRKHQVETVAELVTRRDALRAELDALGSHEERRTELAAALEKARRAAADTAQALTASRRKAAKTLSERVEKALGELAMSGARVVVDLVPAAAQKGDPPSLVVDGRRLAAAGWDRVELLLAANPGEDARPLARVASGGELSRIMLALKRILAKADQVATYVFDEIDTGVGGSVADVVGRRIRDVAGEKQVICITHLAQIAAYAETHFRVEKATEKGRTRTLVRRLATAERREEVARMLGGAKITDKARAHADEMLKAARA